jgi:DNA polymerase-3 subunit gamma/tau
MVSQDARTTQLMEVPDSVRKKYAQQAQTASPSLLLTWLNIANQCDIAYKGSKNQRLTVELALMKMAHVGAVIPVGQLAVQANGVPADAGLKKKLV